MKESTRTRHHRTNHVFLFRHCVRSTESVVDFHDGHGKQDASDFLGSSLPAWNTPEHWCTERGIDIIKETGRYLMSSFLSTFLVNASRIRVNFVSDLSLRDADTAFALAEGMGSTSSYSIPGLFDLHYDPILFSPLANMSENGLQRLCEPLYTREQYKNDVLARLQTIPSPRLHLNRAIQLLQALGGPGRKPLNSSSDSAFTLMFDERKDRFALQGAVNAIDLFAQMLFYTRASAISFLPNATMSQVYELLEWAHWTRTVLDTRNVRAAIEGTVLAHAMLTALQKSNNDNDDDVDHAVTVLVGHDGNIDALATVLGIKWQLPLPYKHTDITFNPTPPGSAMYFSFNTAHEEMRLAYLYPVFDAGSSPRLSGSLHSAPMQFDPPIMNTTIQDNVTVVNFRELRSRIYYAIRHSPGAWECYQKAASRPSQLFNDGAYPIDLSISSLQLLGTTLKFVVVLAFVAMLTKRFKGIHQGKQRA